MVQTSSFVVLTAIALGAVSTVSAVPVYPGQAPAPAPAPPVRGSQRPTGLKPQQPQYERPASLIAKAGAERVENAGRPQRLTGEQRVQNTLKSQNERLENMEKTDLRIDTQRETQLKGELKAYEGEAARLKSNLGSQQRLGMQKYRRTVTKPAPAPARPNANIARPGANGANGAGIPPTANNGNPLPGRPISNIARPASNGANGAGIPPQAQANNGRRPPTPQQQLSNQRTALLSEEKKFAAVDKAQYEKLRTEAASYGKQYAHLESEIKESEKPAYMQGIDAQNAAIKGQEGRIADDKRIAEDKRVIAKPGAAPSAQRPGVAPRDLEDDIEFFGRDLEDDVEFFGRDFEDDVEEFAREWDEYDARAVPTEGVATEGAAPAIPQEGAPPTEAAAAEQQPLPAPVAPKKNKQHHGQHKNKKIKKSKSLRRDLEDEAEAFAREWEEFITREWAALEELD